MAIYRLKCEKCVFPQSRHPKIGLAQFIAKTIRFTAKWTSGIDSAASKTPISIPHMPILVKFEKKHFFGHPKNGRGQKKWVPPQFRMATFFW